MVVGEQMTAAAAGNRRGDAGGWEQPSARVVVAGSVGE
jgi:hypothetical protein